MAGESVPGGRCLLTHPPRAWKQALSALVDNMVAILRLPTSSPLPKLCCSSVCWKSTKWHLGSDPPQVESVRLDCFWSPCLPAGPASLWGPVLRGSQDLLLEAPLSFALTQRQNPCPPPELVVLLL